jgi:hypothetical protein
MDIDNILTVFRTTRKLVTEAAPGGHTRVEARRAISASL